MSAFKPDDIMGRALDILLDPSLYYRRIKKDLRAPQNVNSEICSECKGACCKRCGCNFSPEDFGELTFEHLKKEMEKGYISIEIIDREIIYTDFSVLILRARNRNAPIVDIGYKRTPCILLTEKGCKLSYKDRPTGGKLLRPTREFTYYCGQKERACDSVYTLNFCCYEWKPYQKLLVQLARYFEGKDIPCSL